VLVYGQDFGKTEITPRDTIVFDFDGTIANDDGGWEHITSPVDGVKETIEELRALGYHIVISSCRTASYWDNQDADEQRDLMVEFLDRHSIPYDDIWPADKPLAVWYVDDRGIRADGDRWQGELLQMARERKMEKAALGRILDDRLGD